jgi:hypothetical protein
MTHRKAVASGRRAQAGLSKDQLQLETHHGVSVYVELLPYWDMVLQVVNDPAHEIGNIAKHIIGLLGNKSGPGRFNAKRRKYATAIQRSRLGYLRPKERPPFRVSSKARALLNKIVAHLKLPSSWEKFDYMFKKTYRLKTAELLQFAGPLGAYLLMFADIDGVIKKHLVDLLFELEECQAKSHTASSLTRLQNRLVQTLTQLEIRLPVAFNSQVAHVLLHLTTFIRRCGPFKDHNMLVFERWQTVFKKLARGTKNLHSSIENHYTKIFNANLWRCPSQGGDVDSVPGFRSTVMGAKEIDYTDRVWKVRSAETDTMLDEDTYNQLQDLWAIENRTYDRMRDRYRTSVHDRRAQLPPDWDGGRRALTEEEKTFLTMTPAIKLVDRIEYNGLAFRTTASQNRRQIDDATIKIWYNEDNGTRTPAFATIQRMFLHSMTAGTWV